jgi:hypothetical protein
VLYTIKDRGTIGIYSSRFRDEVTVRKYTDRESDSHAVELPSRESGPDASPVHGIGRPIQPALVPKAGPAQVLEKQDDEGPSHFCGKQTNNIRRGRS